MTAFLAINFHYIRSEAYPYPGIHPVTPEAFESQVEHLASRFATPSPARIERFLDNAEDLDGPSVVITFDDGLKEQLRAAEILDAHSVHGFFFVSTAPLAEGKALTVHKGHWVRAHTPPAEFAERVIDASREAGLSAEMFDVDPTIVAAAYRFDPPEIGRIKYALNFLMPEGDREGVLGKIFEEAYPGTEEEFCRDVYLSAEEIRSLHDRGHMIGAHSHAHHALAGLSSDALASDLGENATVLAGVMGEMPRWVSYPYGGPEAVDAHVVEAARRCGFEYGFTMTRGDNGSDADPLLLRRIATNEAPGGSLPEYWVSR